MQDQLLLSKAPSDLNIIHAKGLQLKHPAIGMATQHSCGHDKLRPFQLDNRKCPEHLPPLQAACLLGQPLRNTTQLLSLNQTQRTTE